MPENDPEGIFVITEACVTTFINNIMPFVDLAKHFVMDIGWTDKWTDGQTDVLVEIVI